MTIKRTLLGTLTGVLFIMAVTLLPVESLNAQDAADTASQPILRTSAAIWRQAVANKDVERLWMLFCRDAEQYLMQHAQDSGELIQE